MQPGQMFLKWDVHGHLDIKLSLPITAEARKLAIQVLADAIKAMANEPGSKLLVANGPAVPARILAGS